MHHEHQQDMLMIHGESLEWLDTKMPGSTMCVKERLFVEKPEDYLTDGAALSRRYGSLPEEYE